MVMSKKIDDVEIGRVAMRQEGGFWVGYYAMPESMEGAIELARIKMSLIIGKPERKDFFMLMVADCANDLVEEITGTRPYQGGERPAPKHEKAAANDK